MEGSMLKFIQMVRDANSEEDITSLMDLMNPTDDADEMGNKYNEVLGYNPITYFDEIKVRDIMNEISSKYPNVKFNIDQVVNHANELIEDHKEYAIIQGIFWDARDALISSGHDESDEMDSIIKGIISDKLGKDIADITDILEVGYEDDYGVEDEDFDDEDGLDTNVELNELDEDFDDDDE